MFRQHASKERPRKCTRVRVRALYRLTYPVKRGELLTIFSFVSRDQLPTARSGKSISSKAVKEFLKSVRSLSLTPFFPHSIARPPSRVLNSRNSISAEASQIAIVAARKEMKWEKKRFVDTANRPTLASNDATVQPAPFESECLGPLLDVCTPPA